MRVITACAAFLVLLSSCYPALRATYSEGAGLRGQLREISTPAKVYLLDSTLVVYPSGFFLGDDLLHGVGLRYELGSPAPSQVTAVRIDSVAAMTYYEIENEAGSLIASTLLGLYGTGMIPLSIHCLLCPKCCFGSCPTLYAGAGEDQRLEAELFSYSLSRYYQENDLDRLEEPLLGDGALNIRVTNEALETHYLDEVSLVVAAHAPDVQLFPTGTGGIVSTKHLRPPDRAFNRTGKDVLRLVSIADDNAYRSGTDVFYTTKKKYRKDWIDLKTEIPSGVDSLIIVFRLKNTLLTTVLFYDVVLATQGISAIAWAERLNTDSLYAADYHATYTTYAGLKVYSKPNIRWRKIATIPDVGPITWKYVSAVVPVEKHERGSLSLRVEFFPDNVMIDYIGIDDSMQRDQFILQKATLSSVHDHTGRERADAVELLADDDERFLVTEPGDALRLRYEVESSDQKRTAFVRSNGYYLEWVRGDWLVYIEEQDRFNLYNMSQTMERLRQSWVSGREEIEKRFFHTRIPLKGELR